MATYIPGVTSYMPDMKPFTPDYQFLTSVLDTKTNRYNTNYKAINDLYSKVVYGDLSREDTKQMRNHFSETLAPRLEQISGMDLSVMQNAEAARAIFKPFFEDDLIVKDLVTTRQYINEMNKVNMMQTSPSEEVREQWWPTGIKKMQYEMEDFINASEQEALQMAAPKYVPDADLYQRGKAFLEAQGYDVKIDYVDPANPQWIVTRKNGELVTQQAMFDMQNALLDDPIVQNAYYADAYVTSRDFARDAVESGQFSSIKDAQAAWATRTISNYEEKLAAQNVMLQEEAKNQKSVVVTWDNYKKQEGILPGTREDEQMSQLEQEYEATLNKINRNRNVLGDTKAIDPRNLNSIMNKAYNIIMQTNMNTDLIAAATQWASTHREVSLKENPFEKQRRKFAHDFERQRRKQIFEWQKALLKAQTGGSKSKSGKDEEDPETANLRDLIIKSTTGAAQSESALTLALGYAGTGQKGGVIKSNEEFIERKTNTVLNEGLDAALDLYTKLYHRNDNRYTIFKTGITGTPQEVKAALLKKPNEAAKFISDMYDIINISDGSTFKSNVGPGMAADPKVIENVNTLRNKMGELEAIIDQEDQMDEHYAENYERFLDINPVIANKRPAEGINAALKSGVPNIMHKDHKGNVVPYTWAEYKPLILAYAQSRGAGNLQGYGLNGNNSKPIPPPSQQPHYKKKRKGLKDKTPEAKRRESQDIYNRKVANRMRQTNAVDGNIFYDIWRGQKDAYIAVNEGKLNKPTEDGTVLFPSYNIRMAYEGYDKDAMNVGDVVQTTHYKTFFNPTAIGQTKDGAKEYLTFAQQYLNKGPMSDYVIDFIDNGKQVINHTLAREVLEEIMNRVTQAASESKTPKGEVPSIDITYLPNVNPAAGAHRSLGDGKTEPQFSDVAGYIIKVDSDWMKKIMAGKDSKGKKSSAPHLLGSENIGKYNEIIFTFKKDKDINEKAYNTQEMFSSMLWNIENEDNKQIGSEYPMGGRVTASKNHTGDVIMDLQLSGYNPKTGNHELGINVSKNISEEWRQSGAGQSWYDFKYSAVIEKLQQNAALQQNLERQYKQANSNNLKK